MARDSQASGVALGTLPSYLVVIEAGPASYGAYVPDLPGCIAVGDTRDEVEQLIRQGIAVYLETLRERGEPIPPPASSAMVVPATLTGESGL